MRATLSFGSRTALAMLAVTLVATSTWASEKKLHNFGPYHSDGAGPNTPLVQDAAGNLYGTTNDGGSHFCANQNQYCGLAYTLIPNGHGGWTEKKMHNFGSYSTDGTIPVGGFTMDPAGNLYTATYNGGSHSDNGTVLEFLPNGSGGWTEKKLHNFGSGTDGAHPNGGLVFDANGNIYGTTLYGGRNNGGTVYEMSPNGSGGWTERVVHNFSPIGTGSAYPIGSLVFDLSGNLYGATIGGGDSSCGSKSKCGTVYELIPAGNGTWSAQTLHSFRNDGHDGYSPQAGLAIDTAGNLYGTTVFGGTFNLGTVFEVIPNGSGGWTEKKLHNFGSYQGDGWYPLSNLVLDSMGTLYGTTSDGGGNVCNTNSQCGTVFEMIPSGGGTFSERKLHNFRSGNNDGYTPHAGVIVDDAGNLYGTTFYGGSNGTGTVYEILP